MQFHVIVTDGATAARTGELVTTRGAIRTPVFMPVATRGAVRAISGRDVDELDFDIILSNTYHLYLRPGMEVLEKAGGLHRFMNFHRSILTDSGGFQVFSLSDFCRVRDHGVEFRSHVDGSLHVFTPESVLDIQKTIGSDIMMVLDQCTHYPIEERPAREAMERTADWARSSYAYWRDNFDTGRQALFAIVQGSVFPGLRTECVSRLTESDFPGFAIGGLSVGEPKDLYREITELTLSLLPAGRPRYMMGVGSPMEILYAIRQGTDMFDSVMPTRIARNGTLFTSAGRVNIKSAAFESDQAPLDGACGCYVCRTYSRSYLRHLFRAGEISALIYNTHHNLFFMNSFMNEIRQSITDGTFESTYNKWMTIYKNGDK
ncbi:MAG TPA: tRNA guanosine(34) transglycosylase Tgt [Spirochaetota bacterium]|nr:tRNA guanosine(34) transglycosylase Tgt [Spirochaetota bacterium]HOD14170.1 tRNA guanosine(34) transglycosylase Tgt [Spirochaetota bacterium]HPG51357.1 tRNA guanosine(34) transglycosylase Tgt [Spirochaetota bacterium]HPN12840.1 tRNA guanosine(34) transglycosylase Tgt [Spirochaetota bacterium]HQL80661.1 tRNA guanosine(34) transglycosylase Tgt [Spirochaetota bacterium]